MSWTFNPPPGWPVPPGWQPPSGWSPEPGWPPAPAGWQFWVPAGGPGEAAASSGGPPPAGNVHEAPTSLAYQPAPTPSPPPTPASSLALTPNPTPAPMLSPPSPAGGSGSPTFLAPAPPYSAAGGYPIGGQAAAQPAPSLDQPWHQRWWAIAGAMLSVLLVGCVLGGALAVLTNSDQDPDAGTSAGGAAAAASATGAPASPAAGEPDGSGGLGPGQERAGSGPAIVPLDVPAGGLHTVTLTHSGEGVFHARLLDRDGEFGRGLGGGIGSFTGTYPLELRGFGEPGAVDIVDGDGSWTVTVQELSQAPEWPDQTSGSGATVLRVNLASGGSTVSISHQGRGNIFIWAHVEGEYGDLFVNEIGDWSGSAELRAGTFVLEIDADGDWRIDPS